MSALPDDTNKPKGLVARLVTSVFFRPVQVVGNTELVPKLHRVTLQGESLRDLAWVPGDKLQVRLGQGLQTRTYTPITWDPDAGRTAFLAQTLSPGPGSQWIAHAQLGDRVEVMGPRTSLALDEINSEDVVVLGDETALGLALAWGAGRAVLEVADPKAMAQLCSTLGLRCTLFARQAHGGHLPDMEAAMWEGAALRTHFVLAGRASTVQRLHQRLRAGSVQARRIQTKAYWADGKAGLD